MPQSLNDPLHLLLCDALWPKSSLPDSDSDLDHDPEQESHPQPPQPSPERQTLGLLRVSPLSAMAGTPPPGLSVL